MNTTTYRKPIPSPFHLVRQLQKKAFDVQDQAHPAREEMKKCVGTHNLVAIIEEDKATLSAMSKIDGLIAFLCTLKLKEGGRVISQGRGSSVLSPTNRYMTRAIASALNSSLADAVIRATKVLGTFYTNSVTQDTSATLSEVYSTKERATAFEPATQRQKEYLHQLISVQVDSDVERDGWEQKLTEMSKNEASEMIASFKQ